MPSCKNCGAELEGDEDFCPSCGAPVKAKEEEIEKAVEHGIEKAVERYSKQRDEGCFGGGGGLWGAISGGVFIIGLGLLWYLSSIGVEWAWWPGILFLIGIMIVVGGIAGYLRRQR